ncbi:MAG: C4-type zinc ribbon domain-containing protein, partial [Bifidobacteriaceae bacterium]|nr:C4-type zinc ribbon domain-containing protein [Bifidobacteriaceae bacterium]
RLRASRGGVGAAALRGATCGGCRLELNPHDLQAIRVAAEDEVVRCEECGRILVRVPGGAV